MCLIPRASVSFIETSYEKSFSVTCTASILRTKLLHDVLWADIDFRDVIYSIQLIRPKVNLDVFAIGYPWLNQSSEYKVD